MKADDIINVLGDLDESMVRHTEERRAKKTTPSIWMKWIAAAAAVLVLIAAAVFLFPKLTPKKDPAAVSILPSGNNAELNQGPIFILDIFPGVEYHEVNGEDREKYDLPQTIERNEQGEITAIYGADASREDLGEVLGKVVKVFGSSDSALIGKSAYLYNKMPERKNICILDDGENLRFLRAYGYQVHISAGETLSGAFQIYGFPEKCRSIHVEGVPDYDSLMYNIPDEDEIEYTITDKDKQECLFELLLSGISVEGPELKQRAADLWKDTYENEQYRINEKGDLVYFPEGEARYITGTDSEGGEWSQFYWPEKDLLEKQVHNLLYEENIEIEIENTDGFILTILINPKLRSLDAGNSGFDMQKEKMEELVNFIQDGK